MTPASDRPGLVRRALIAPIRFYKRFLSPLLPPACRFYPTCSIYAITALERFGAARGFVLAAWRILRCNPFCRGGIDFVPPRVPGEPFRVTLGKVRRHECRTDGTEP